MSIKCIKHLSLRQSREGGGVKQGGRSRRKLLQRDASLWVLRTWERRDSGEPLHTFIHRDLFLVFPHCHIYYTIVAIWYVQYCKPQSVLINSLSVLLSLSVLSFWSVVVSTAEKGSPFQWSASFGILCDLFDVGLTLHYIKHFWLSHIVFLSNRLFNDPAINVP